MTKTNPTSVTTAQSLGALLKSARDIMRKDKGLNGDLDRLPMLTWIMFLKFLDDLELQREGEAKLATKKFKPAIEPPFAGAMGHQVRWHHFVGHAFNSNSELKKARAQSPAVGARR